MKRFVVKVVLLILAVVALQFIFGSKTPREIRAIDKALTEKLDIVFLCDSTNFVCDPNDTDRRSISQMLQDKLPQRKVLTIDHGAYQMDIYKSICDYLAAHDNRPELIIIPVNMRSFSPSWDLRPNWQFEKEHFFLRYKFLGKFYKPLAIFGAVSSNTITYEEFYNTKVYENGKEIGKISDFIIMPDASRPSTLKERQKAFLFNYTYIVECNHRKLRSMENIIETLNSESIKVLFYFEPMNFEMGYNLIGDDFAKRVHSNIDIIKKILKSKQAEFLDLSELLDEQKFTGDHIDQYGRQAVAEQLAQFINSN